MMMCFIYISKSRQFRYFYFVHKSSKQKQWFSTIFIELIVILFHLYIWQRAMSDATVRVLCKSTHLQHKSIRNVSPMYMRLIHLQWGWRRHHKSYTYACMHHIQSDTHTHIYNTFTYMREPAHAFYAIWYSKEKRLDLLSFYEIDVLLYDLGMSALLLLYIYCIPLLCHAHTSHSA